MGADQRESTPAAVFLDQMSFSSSFVRVRVSGLQGAPRRATAIFPVYWARIDCGALGWLELPGGPSACVRCAAWRVGRRGADPAEISASGSGAPARHRIMIIKAMQEFSRSYSCGAPWLAVCSVACCSTGALTPGRSGRRLTRGLADGGPFPGPCSSRIIGGIMLLLV